MASPKKLSHLVLQTNRRPEMIDWYCTVLGAEILYQNQHIGFISYDDEHHRVALIDMATVAPEAAGADRRGVIGVDHVAYTYDTVDDLLEN